jgi:thioesterase domain-containing protein
VDARPQPPIGAAGGNALPEPHASRPLLSNPYKRPRDPLEQLLTEIWEECLKVRPIGTTDHFLELGGDSLLAVRMLRAVEQRTGKSLRPDVMLTGGTVKHLAGELLKPVSTAEAKQLVEVQAGHPGQRLFFLHGDYNGGGLYCVNLARHLGSEQAFYALQPHGLTEPVVPQTIEEMAADHLDTLIAFQAEGPYLLGGHCNGGLIALEMAHELVRRGQQLALLLLIDPPPLLGQSLDSLPYLVKNPPGPNEGRPPRLGLIDVDHEKRRPILTEIYRRACGRYHLRPYPGPLCVVEPQVKRTMQGAPVNWKQVNPAVDLAIVPGSHFTMLTKHVEELAAVLRARLASP